METEVIVKIHDMLAQKVSFNKILEITGIDKNALKALIADYKKLNKTESVNFCLLSDIHYGSIYDRVDLVNRAYDLCAKRGITDIFCAGDLTDGYYPYRDRYRSEQKVKGFDEMLTYVVDHHPFDESIKFYTISGNHDNSFLTYFKVDMCKAISKERSDIIYLGKDEARFLYHTLDIALIHGRKKQKRQMKARNLSYYNSFPNDKPDLIALGHIHHSYYSKVQNTHVLQIASLTNANKFALEYNLDNEQSMYFVSAFFADDGNLCDFEYEKIAFNKTRKR